MNRRQPVPELRERLRLLLASGRSPSVETITALDHALGLAGERSFRQWYRGDRESGIPHALLDRFLTLFRLRLDELLLPMIEFERLLSAAAPTERAPIGWRGAEKYTQTARSSVRPPGDVIFDWPALGMSVGFVSEAARSTIAHTGEPMQLLNLRRRNTPQACVRLQREFRFDLSLPEKSPRQLLGLVEGTEISCFHQPSAIDPASRRIRVPTGGDPFYFDDLGRHTMWLLLFSGVRLNALDLKELDHDDGRVRREAAERIYASAQQDSPESLIVLRADFDVVA